MSDLNPIEIALKARREERQLQKDLCEETRRTTTDIGMKPVDQSTRLTVAVSYRVVQIGSQCQIIVVIFMLCVLLATT